MSCFWLYYYRSDNVVCFFLSPSPLSPSSLPPIAISIGFIYFFYFKWFVKMSFDGEYSLDSMWQRCKSLFYPLPSASPLLPFRSIILFFHIQRFFKCNLTVNIRRIGCRRWNGRLHRYRFGSAVSPLQSIKLEIVQLLI